MHAMVSDQELGIFCTLYLVIQSQGVESDVLKRYDNFLRSLQEKVLISSYFKLPVAKSTIFLGANWAKIHANYRTEEASHGRNMSWT